MKVRKVKNFRILENGKTKRVYFTHKGEERFIGFFRGHLSHDDAHAERELTDSVCNYKEVIKKWECSK
jgi:hypothetical protein